MTPLLREASLSDLEILAHLHAVCFESPWGIDAFRKFLQSERAFALLAGEESNFFMSPPHFAQCAYGGSETRWMISARSPHFVH